MLSAHLFFNGTAYGPDGDRVLREVVEPFVARCRVERWIERHFFTRSDESTGGCVRAHFAGEAAVLEESVWPWLVEHARGSGVMHVERGVYAPRAGVGRGEAARDTAERLFEASSDAAYALLRSIGPERSSRIGKAVPPAVILIHSFAPARAQGGAFAEAVARSLPMAGDEEVSDTLMAYVDEVWSRSDAGESLSDTLDAYAAALRAAQLMEGEPEHDLHVHFHLMNDRLGLTPAEERIVMEAIARGLAADR
ncbi:MAG TPA: lantibiotic dehydratase C-terminal domain-containing protein [Thermoanaerobaculia bacterium]|jgi:hypothetical protein